jgi:hypothetical protein
MLSPVLLSAGVSKTSCNGPCPKRPFTGLVGLVALRGRAATGWATSGSRMLGSGGKATGLHSTAIGALIIRCCGHRPGVSGRLLTFLLLALFR